MGKALNIKKIASKVFWFFYENTFKSYFKY
jgi:hypothetical protein